MDDAPGKPALPFVAGDAAPAPPREASPRPRPDFSRTVPADPEASARPATPFEEARPAASAAARPSAPTKAVAHDASITAALLDLVASDKPALPFVPAGESSAPSFEAPPAPAPARVHGPFERTLAPESAAPKKPALPFGRAVDAPVAPAAPAPAEVAPPFVDAALPAPEPPAPLAAPPEEPPSPGLGAEFLAALRGREKGPSPTEKLALRAGRRNRRDKDG
jgi:hypothetical protein